MFLTEEPIKSTFDNRSIIVIYGVSFLGKPIQVLILRFRISQQKTRFVFPFVFHFNIIGKAFVPGKLFTSNSCIHHDKTDETSQFFKSISNVYAYVLTIENYSKCKCFSIKSIWLIKIEYFSRRSRT